MATVNKRHDSEIHLIDPTGISKCRAYAIGKYSAQLNKKLSEENFTHLTVEEGAQLLLHILQDCNTKRWDADVHGSSEAWGLPSETFAEILIINALGIEVTRLRQHARTK